MLKKFYCPDHGFLVEAPEAAIVLCGTQVTRGALTRRCNKRAAFGKDAAAPHMRSRRRSVA